MQATLKARIRKSLYAIMIVGMLLSDLGVNNVPAARAREGWTETPTPSETPTIEATPNTPAEIPTHIATENPTARAQEVETELPTFSQNICMIDGTVQIPSQGMAAIKSALAVAIGDVNFKNAECFALIDLRDEGEWSLLTLVGVVGVQPDSEWTVSSNGVWSDLALIHYSDSSVSAAIAGTVDFSELLAQIPETIFSQDAKEALDPLLVSNEALNALESYIFPFESGTLVKFFRFHWDTSENYTFWTGANSKAVDLGSDGNTGANHAPNRLLAVAPGWVRQRCSQEGSYSSTYIAVQNDDGAKIIYAHLNKSDAPPSGTHISQGQYIGTLKTGPFTDGVCGRASQGSSEFHVHFEVPDTSSLTLSDWTLNTSTGVWTKGSETWSPGQWKQIGGPGPCPGPSLNSPSDGYVSSSQTISFSWSAPSGCTFEGYTFRIKDTSNMDSGGTTIVDTGNSSTSRTETIGSQWNNRDLYWGVRTANPLSPNWSVRRFRIEPSVNCPGPSLNSPPDGYVSSSQTINFSWSAPSGCTFEGYTFRIKDTSNMDSGGTTIVDTGNSSTSRTETIGSQWNNRDLYWGVRTANPLSPNWAVRRFRIEPNLCTDCGPANSAWPLYRQNALHTGRSPYTGPSNPRVKWTYDTFSYGGSSPVIGPDGIIYVGLNNTLYAFYPNGEVKWSYTTGGAVKSPAIAANGTVYAGSSDGIIYAIKADGTLKWSFTTEGLINDSPALSPEGIIYFGSFDGKLYALWPDGTLKWSYTIGSWQNPSPAIGPDGTIYQGSTTWSVYALTPDGHLKWEYPTGNYVDASPAVGTDGTVYIGSDDHYLYALNPNGTLKWRYNTGDTVWSPGIGADGTIYAGSDDNYLYAINPGGILKWRYLTGGYVGTPSIDDNGVIYVGSRDCYLYAINPSGSLKWRILLEGYLESNPVIGPDQTLYITSSGKLFAIASGYTLTVGKNGTGSGTVTSDPAGINCGTDCSESYDYNTSVTLTATAATGSTFTGWSGGGCSGAGTCTVIMDADKSVTASFTKGSVPGAFNKSSPSNGATNRPASLTLNWGASTGAMSYEYCYDTTNDNACDGNAWVSTGTARSAAISGLTPGTTYYWQARANNAAGSTYANGGVWWSFTTRPLPGAFSKTSPANGATNRPASLTLSWGASSRATSYEYCYDTTNDNACDGNAWVSTGTAKSAAISGLSQATVYYWQVRANNSFGTTYANGGVWWSFKTRPLPGAFGKTGPVNGATNRPRSLTLSWGASSGATSYKYCIDTSNDTVCDTGWVSTGTARSASLSGLTPSTTYYWQARANNSFGTTYANGGAWWRFTTAP